MNVKSMASWFQAFNNDFNSNHGFSARRLHEGHVYAKKWKRFIQYLHIYLWKEKQHAIWWKTKSLTSKSFAQTKNCSRFCSFFFICMRKNTVIRKNHWKNSKKPHFIAFCFNSALSTDHCDKLTRAKCLPASTLNLRFHVKWGVWWAMCSWFSLSQNGLWEVSSLEYMHVRWEMWFASALTFLLGALKSEMKQIQKSRWFFQV